MPFKCTKCSTIVQDNEQQICQCDLDHFVKCPIIHFLHTEGEGPVFSKNQKVTRIPGQIEVKQSAPIRIACTARKDMEQCTVLPSIVSCPVCMSFIASKRAPKEETIVVDKPLDVTNLDVSPADMNILGLPTDHNK